jgi:hypothetical protein
MGANTRQPNMEHTSTHTHSLAYLPTSTQLPTNALYKQKHSRYSSPAHSPIFLACRNRTSSRGRGGIKQRNFMCESIMLVYFALSHRIPRPHLSHLHSQPLRQFLLLLVELRVVLVTHLLAHREDSQQA